jgi:peptidoglycan/LPS O-acetylase OafA/YrhL
MAHTAMTRELISCHDCGWSVSFSAAACPNCGSREPSGPYRFSSREARMRRVAEFDGLRAIAVTLVMIFHTTRTEFAGGWIGVDIFFVLSGFLITSILAREFDDTSSIKFGQFYIRRALRLFPALALMLALYAAIVLPFTTDFSRYFEAIIAAAFYGMNWIRAFQIDAEGHIGHTWSLAVEEQFYLVWPLVLIFAMKRGGRPLAFKVALALVAAVAIWRMYLTESGAVPIRTYAGFDTRADALFIGCAFALISLSSDLTALATRTVAIPIAVIMAVSFLTPWDTRWLALGGSTVIATCAAWLLVACLNEPKGLFFSLLRSAPIQYCGRISYGIYLWHAMMASLLSNSRYHFSPLLISLIVPPVTLIIATASFFLIEKPFLKLKERFEPIGDHEGNALTSSARGCGIDIVSAETGVPPIPDSAVAK